MVKRSYRNGLLVLVLMSAVLFSAESAFAWKKNFIFINESGRTVWHLYIKGASWKGGYRDLLGSSFLPDDSVKQYKYSGRHKFFDIMIVFRDGERVLFRSIDFRPIEGLTLIEDNDGYSLRLF